MQALRAALGEPAVRPELLDQVPFKAQNRYSAVRVRASGTESALALGALESLRAEVPSSTVSLAALDDPVALLVQAALASSKGEGRRLIEQGGLSANGRRLAPGDTLTAASLLHGRFLLLRRGRSQYHLLEIVAPPG